jgi:PleD family two-component response regulator
VLLASGDDWSARPVETVLQGAGYRVLRVATGAAVRAQARSARPDCVVISSPLPDMDGVDVCRGLREDPRVAPDVPIVGHERGAVTRARRLEWLRAGAWDVFGFPLDVEELALKLAAYRRGKQSSEAGQEAGALVDGVTGLYTERGLQRRARELAAEAARLHASLACVAFAPEPRRTSPETRSTALETSAMRQRVGRVLRTAARLSDTVGWGDGVDFAVLALVTDDAGAVNLARRLADAIETAPPEPAPAPGPGPALRVRAGYDVLASGDRPRPESDDLLARARAALQLARSGGNGGRIRRFEAGPQP